MLSRSLAIIVPTFLSASLSAQETPVVYQPKTQFQPGDIEKRIRDIAPRLAAATVGIVQRDDDIDPSGIGYGGSGVFASAEGLILTVAHVIAGAENGEVIVMFGDRRRAKAEIVGYIGRGDMGLVRMKEKGPYPFLPQAACDCIDPGAFCLGAGHTGRIDFDRPPPIRMGRILTSRREESFVDEFGDSTDIGRVLVSDAPFLPGDSGGPLVNLAGELIGLHSSIGADHRENMHIPIWEIRRNWERMLAGEKRTLPRPLTDESETIIYPSGYNKAYTGDFRAAAARSWSRSHPNFLKRFDDVVSPAAGITVQVFRDDRAVALGVVVSSDGSILTKGEAIGEGAKLVCRVQERDYPATVAARDEAHDLALLKISAEKLTPAVWSNKPPESLGTLLVSTDARGRPLTVGVLSVPRRNIADASQLASSNTHGFLGIELHPTARTAKIAGIVDASAAQTAGLEPGDVLLAINEKPIARGEDVYETMRRFKPGDAVKILIERRGKRMTLHAELGKQPAAENDDDLEFAPWSRTSGGISKRKTNLPNVVTHDGFVPARSCGGPVFDLTGELVGLNIARADRTATYVLPADEVQGVLKKMLPR